VILVSIIILASCLSPLAPTRYEVLYSANTGSGTPPTDGKNYQSGDKVTVQGEGSLTKTGYTFAGWNTAANGSGDVRAVGSTFVMGNGDVTLYAMWTQNPTYTVTYNANTGSGPPPTDSNNYQAGDTVTVQGKGSLTKVGYTFAGWNTVANGSGDDRAIGSTFEMDSTSVVLYALWTQNPTYTVTYDANKGSGTPPTDSNSYQAGDSVAVLGQGSLTKTGYTFGGWNTTANGSGANREVGACFTIGNENEILYAVWEQNQYRLNVDAGVGGSASGGGTVPYGTAHDIRATPNDKYVFTNWTVISGMIQISELTAASTSVYLMSGDATVMANFGATIQVVAGNGVRGYSGDYGPATAAMLRFPTGVVVDAVGDIYIADQSDHRIRKVIASTGVIRTIAGDGFNGYSGDGEKASSAELNYPTGVALDPDGNLYIADYFNCRVRKIDASTGIITTVAGNGTCNYSGDGGLATSAALKGPTGVAVDSAGNLYIADPASNCIRKVDHDTGFITTVAGNGTAGNSSLELRNPRGVAVDTLGNVYIADSGNNRICKLNSGEQYAVTIGGTGTAGYAGDGGLAVMAMLNSPQGIALSENGDIFIADEGNNRIRRIDAGTGIITTIVGVGTTGSSGDGGAALAAELWSPRAVCIDRDGNIIIADTCNFRIREVP